MNIMSGNAWIGFSSFQTVYLMNGLAIKIVISHDAVGHQETFLVNFSRFNFPKIF